MDVEKLRPAFEAYMAAKRGYPLCARNTSPGVTNDYASPYVGEAWEAWKAAIENMQPEST